MRQCWPTNADSDQKVLRQCWLPTDYSILPSATVYTYIRYLTLDKEASRSIRAHIKKTHSQRKHLKKTNTNTNVCCVCESSQRSNGEMCFKKITKYYVILIFFVKISRRKKKHNKSVFLIWNRMDLNPFCPPDLDHHN